MGTRWRVGEGCSDERMRKRVGWERRKEETKGKTKKKKEREK
jgi:hypothetical protein